MTDPKQEIKYVSFNQDQTKACFVCATVYGFKVYPISSSSMKPLVVRDLKESVRLIEMLYRTNLFAIVGTSNLSTKLNSNKVTLWDDYLETSIGELSYKSKIRIKYKSFLTFRIMVGIDGVVYIHKLQDLELLHRVETVSNLDILVGFSINEKTLAYVDRENTNNFYVLQVDKPSNTKRLHVKAHSSTIASITINSQGNLVATSSEKGTLIRLYSADDGTLVQEFRRGTDHQKNICLSFSVDSCFISCLTENNMAYVFVIGSEMEKGHDDKKGDDKKPKVTNTKSKLSVLKIVSNFFDAEWSYANVKLCDKKSITSVIFNPESKHLYGIGEDGTISIAKHDGKSLALTNKDSFLFKIPK